MILKQIKYILLFIVVSCSSKETEYKDLAITYIKTYLYDPKAFELINYQLDTLRWSDQVLVEYDSIDELDEEFFDYDTLASLSNYFKVAELSDLLDNLEDNYKLDTMVGYQSVVRYYYTRANRDRVIHTLSVYHDMNGNILRMISLDDKNYRFK